MIGRRTATDRGLLTETRKRDTPRRRALRPGRRGWDLPGGGYATVVEPPPEFRGTTVQVCGLWPSPRG